MQTPSPIAVLLCVAGAGGCMVVAGVDFGDAHERTSTVDEAGVAIPTPNEPGDLCGADRYTCNGACVAKSDPSYGCGGAACIPCSVAFATNVKCSGNKCAPDGCIAGRDDCDGDPTNGCEASLSTAATCGSCGTKCPDAARLCSAGTCVAACPAGLSECGGSCVDLKTSVEHCGVCDRKCNAPANGDAVCLNSTCGFACRSGFGDCANNPATTCAPLPKWYRDEDDDKIGGATTKQACTAPAGHVAAGGDCLDTNNLVFPGQTTMFGTPFTNAVGAPSFDYDCNGVESEGASPPPHWPGCSPTCASTYGYLPGASRPGAGVNVYCGSTSARVCYYAGPSGCVQQTPTASAVTCR